MWRYKESNLAARIFNPLLYQLSYISKWKKQDLNLHIVLPITSCLANSSLTN